MSDKKLKAVYQQAVDIIRSTDIDFSEKVKLGFISSHDRWGECSLINKQFSIRINKCFFDKEFMQIPDSNNLLITIMIHELLHIIGIKNKEHGHQGIWKKLAQHISQQTKYQINTSGAYPKKLITFIFKDFPYIIGCPKCDYLFGRKRLSNVVKFPEKYVCPYCNVPLKKIK